MCRFSSRFQPIRAVGRFRPPVTATFLFVLLVLSVPDARAQIVGPFTIDGVVPDAAATPYADPFGTVQELGPLNGTDTKVEVIHTATPPMLGFTNPNNQLDLRTIYAGKTTDANGDLWVYLAWRRVATTGSGTLMFEFQQSPLPEDCNFANVNQVAPIDGGEGALIANCNPWENRQAGDFVIVWDQQGNDLPVIILRTFQATGEGALELDAGINLTGSFAFAANGNNGSKEFGELLINLTDTVFVGGPTSCLSVGNVLPNTVTGNSDTADYKDTLFNPNIAANLQISNCGAVQVIKDTEPEGGTGTFNYTLSRSGGEAVRFPDDGGQTSLSGTLTEDGDSDTVVDLIAAGNYTLSEEDPGVDWDLQSISCVLDGTTYNVSPGTANFPVAIGKVTVCTITNLFIKADPLGATIQSARLHDSLALTGIRPSAPDRAIDVVFRLYSAATCAPATQVGSSITAALIYSTDGTTAAANTFTSAGISVGAGTYYWTVTYAGDAFNNGFTTPCGSEVTTVSFVQ